MTEDDESGFDLSRRKVLGGVLTVGAASAATGAGTMAYFSDTEESTGNTVDAGTLDLTVNGHNDIDHAPVQASGVAPGWDKSIPLDLKNEGSVEGDLYIKFTIADSDDGDAHNDGGDDDNTGLEDDLNLTWAIEGNQNEVSLNQATGKWHSTGQTLGDSGEVSGSLGLKLPTDVGNEAQGESVTVDVAIQLLQSEAESPN